MGDYLVPLEDAKDNLVYTSEGRVWATYYLRGINTTPYRASSLTTAQSENKALFNALSVLPTDDILLGGFKASTRPEDILARVIDGIPNLSAESHPEMNAEINEFDAQLEAGLWRECSREIVLAVEIPTAGSASARALSKASGGDVFADLDRVRVLEAERELFAVLPATFKPRRGGPEMLHWMHDRMRTRGLEVIPMPKGQSATRFNPKSFADVMIYKAADSDAITDTFIDRMRQGVVTTVKTKRRAEDREKWLAQFRRNFRSVRWGTALSVHSVGERTDSMPDGPGSRQALIAIESYPTVKTAVINTFTYLVDQAIGLDGDWALRLSFDQEGLSVDNARKFKRTLGMESDANSEDEFDADDYGNRWREVQALQAAAKEEPKPRGMRVAAIFALADPNPQILENNVRSVIEQFESNHFAVTRPVGGQFELLKMMLPGSSRTEFGTELQQDTTTHLFSACMPVRRTHAGDAVGMPFAINKENDLGQIIHLDVLGATDKGSGSLAATGAQGSGKSLTFKRIIAFMAAVGAKTVVVDQSTHGEYEVFARGLTKVEVVDALYPNVSLDPLKVMPYGQGKTVFLDLMLPLMGLSHDSAEALLLSECLSEKSRAAHSINSSRDLMDYLRDRVGTPEGERLHRALKFWAGQSYTKALFDPLDSSGRPVILPAYNPSALCVVFRTRGLDVYYGDLTDQTTPSQRFAQVLYTAIAEVTAFDFSRTPEVCGFIADEVSFLKGSNVLEKLVRKPDRVGRKERNFVVAGSQLADDLDAENYGLIRKKLAMKQDTDENAPAALAWVGVPPTPKQIERMKTDTSPADPDDNNKVKAGRHGEGWFNDGVTVVRSKTFPMLRPDHARLADTTSSVMIRVEDPGMLAHV